MILKKLSDYVEEVGQVLSTKNISNDDYYYEFHQLITERTKLLKQKPELGMFVPCDLDGNVLEKPKSRCIDYDGISTDDFILIQERYQEAEERVLFKGFKVVNSNDAGVFIKNKDGLYIENIYDTFYVDYPLKIETLEDLTPYNLELK